MNKTKYEYRNVYCGAIKETKNNTIVVGWVQKIRILSKMIFIDLRDWTGLLQIVVFAKNSSLYEKAKRITSESIVQFTGDVVCRKTVNPKLDTGNFELLAEKMNIISISKELPMEVCSIHESSESTRMKYRYLDIRREQMLSNLRIRNAITNTIRNYFQSNGYLEIETPILNSSTPEGARDFIVPSRNYLNKFYSLPQSPQLFKQLLMISGIEKYFQICKTFRDEDLRADRQLEFTQLDIENSFCDVEEFQNFLEELMKIISKMSCNPDWSVSFNRIDYSTMMSKYGSDKADLRYDYQIVDLDRTSNLCFVKSIDFENVDLKGEQISVFHKIINSYNLASFQTNKKELISEKYSILPLENKNNTNRFRFVAKGTEKEVRACLGEIRTRYILLFCEEVPEYKFTWVDNFPLFEKNKENQLESSHHPFTKPINYEDLYTKNPEEIFGTHYDLILNGYELGSGSERIIDGEQQRRVFEILKYEQREIDQNFGFFLEAFKYGTPPHQGIGLGLDRLIMIMTNNKSIKDVIAFPKNSAGICPLTNSPSSVNSQYLKELGILKHETKEETEK